MRKKTNYLGGLNSAINSAMTSVTTTAITITRFLELVIEYYSYLIINKSNSTFGSENKSNLGIGQVNNSGVTLQSLFIIARDSSLAALFEHLLEGMFGAKETKELKEANAGSGVSYIPSLYFKLDKPSSKASVEIGIIDAEAQNSIIANIKKCDITDANNIRLILKDLNKCSKYDVETIIDSDKKSYTHEALTYQSLLRPNSTLSLYHTVIRDAFFPPEKKKKNASVENDNMDIDEMDNFIDERVIVEDELLNYDDHDNSVCPVENEEYIMANGEKLPKVKNTFKIGYKKSCASLLGENEAYETINKLSQKKVYFRDKLSKIRDRVAAVFSATVNTEFLEAFTNVKTSKLEAPTPNTERSFALIDIIRICKALYSHAVTTSINALEIAKDDFYNGVIDEEQYSVIKSEIAEEKMKKIKLAESLTRTLTEDLGLSPAEKGHFNYVASKSSVDAVDAINTNEESTNQFWQSIMPNEALAFVFAGKNPEELRCGYKLLPYLKSTKVENLVSLGQKINFVQGYNMEFGVRLQDSDYTGELEVSLFDGTYNATVAISDLVEEAKVEEMPLLPIKIKSYSLDIDEYMMGRVVESLNYENIVKALNTGDSFVLRPTMVRPIDNKKLLNAFCVIVDGIEIPVGSYYCASQKYERLTAGLTFDYYDGERIIGYNGSSVMVFATTDNYIKTDLWHTATKKEKVSLDAYREELNKKLKEKMDNQQGEAKLTVSLDNEDKNF